AVVVGDVGGRAHSVRADGPTHELAHRVLPGDLPGADLGGDHVLGQGVAPLETHAPGDRDLPDAPEELQGVLDLVPVPPGPAGTRCLPADVGRSGGAALAELGAHGV